jgi:predicted aspartyl protease
MRHVAFALAAVSFVAITARAETEVPADAVVATLPFLVADTPNQIHLDLAREGRSPFRVMLDTGASFTVFTPLAAREAGVSIRALKSTPYRESTRLGRDVQFEVDTSSSDTGARTGWEYGLLGANFLQQYVVEIDFVARTVRFLDPDAYRVPEQANDAGEVVIPMKLTSGRPLIDIRIDGQTLEVMLDTGCNVPAVLSGNAAKSVGIDVDALPVSGEMQTVMGKLPTKRYDAREVELGGERFAGVPIIVSPKGWFNQGGSTSAAIGYALVEQFLVRIDYPRKRIWLRPRSGAARTN